MSRIRTAIRYAPFLCAMALLALLAPHSATAGTNNSSTLEVLSGETLTLNGVNSYTGSITIRSGGTLQTGSSNSLELRAPVITIENGAVVRASYGGNGGTLRLRGETVSVSGVVHASGGTDLNGGTVDIRAEKSLGVSGAGANLWATGGPGWNNPMPDGLGHDGGDGGTISLFAPAITFTAPGGVSVAGGQGGMYEATGGAGGTVAIRAGTLTRAGNVFANGGSCGPITMGGEAYGGPGGSVSIDAARDKGSFPIIDVSGGNSDGYWVDPPNGSPGTITSRIAAWAPFATAPTIDGTVDPAGQWAKSWRWTFPTSDDVCAAYVHTDGTKLYVGMTGPGTRSNNVWDVMIDANGDGAALPQADDLVLRCDDFWGNSEWVGTGTGWTQRGVTAWSAALPAPTAPAAAEFAIDLAKLGIVPGYASTVRLALRRNYNVAPTRLDHWPDGASQAAPSTWTTLSSLDLWTLPGNTPPGGWAAFAPATSPVRNPVCSIQVGDAIGGLDVSRAEYRYTSNSGSTWSAWLPGSCTGSDGTTQTQTITSAAVPFPADSLTANRVQFRVFDMYGMAGTSGEMTVRVDATAPGGWSGFTPAAPVADTVSPDCTVVVQDGGTGLEPSSAEYRYSRDGGSSWSGWLPASCTGASGTLSAQTVTAVSVPFDQTSTANRVQFRIRDIAGVTGTSPVHPVTTSGTITGLPRNGSVDLGSVNRVPSLWRVTTSYTRDGAPWTDIWYQAYAHNTEAARFDGTRATAGRVYVEPGSAPRTYVAEAVMTASAADDYTGIDHIDLAMRDIDLRIETGMGGIWSNPQAYVAVDVGDGTTTSTVQLYRVSHVSGTQDWKYGTATGADGAEWNLYRVPLGSLDRSDITVAVRWHADGRMDWPPATITCASVVDWIHAVDTVRPTSAAIGPIPYWGRTAPAAIAFTAADNASLASISLWGQADTGAGWSPWSSWAGQAIAGRSATGSFAVPGPVVDGRYALRTIAVDSVGNAETAPVIPDATFGIDSMGPVGWASFSPAGWATTKQPPCEVTVYDLTSGLWRQPVRWGAGTAPAGTPTTMWSGDGHVLAGEGDVLSVVKVGDLSGTTVGSRDLGKPVRDVVADPDWTWAFCGLDVGGVVPVDISDPTAPEPAPQADIGSVRHLALHESHSSTFLYAATAASPMVQILDVTAPAGGIPRRGELEVPGVPNVLIVTETGVLLIGTNTEIFAYDIADPTAPALLDVIPVFGVVSALDSVGGLTFVGDTGGRVLVLDATDPRSLHFRGSVDVFRTIVDLVVEGDRVFVMTADDGVRVVSVTDPEVPERLWELDRSFTGVTGGTLALGRGCLVTQNADCGRQVWSLPEPVVSWTSDGGATWSDWFVAGTPTEGTTGTVTLAYTPSFEGDSASADQVRWRAGDQLGNLSDSPIHTVLVDSTAPGAPVISSTHSNPASWYPSAAPIMDWTIPSDTSGITGYSYLWADNSIADPDFTADTSDTETRTTGVPDGQHWFSVRARDGAGQWGGAAKLLYQVDVSPPGTPGGMAANPSSWSSATSYVVSWTLPASTPAPLANMKYGVGTIPGGAGDGTLLPSTATTVAVPFSTDGTTAVYVQGVDAAGNRGPFASVVLYHDGTAPGAPAVSSSTHPVQTTYYGGATIACSWTIPSDTSGIVGYSWAWTDSDASVPDDIVDTTGTTASQSVGADGLHYFHVRAKDAAGNWSPTAHFAYRVDRNAPGAPVVSSPTHPVSANYYNGATVTADWTAPADASGVTAYSFVWDGAASTVPDTLQDTTLLTASTPAGADGTYYFHVRARDALGNWGATAHLTYRVDRTAPAAPSGPAASPSAWTSLTSFTLSWTNPTGQVAPLASRWYKLGTAPTGPTDGTQVSGGTASLSLSGITAEGTQTIYVWLQDAAGNRNQANAAQVRIYRDGTPPGQPSIVRVTPSEWTSGSATVTWVDPPSDGLSPVAYTRYKVSSSLSAPAAGDYDARVAGSSPSLSLPTPPEGLWWVHVWLEDAAGNCGPSLSTNSQMRIDRTAPAAPQNLRVSPSSWSVATTCVVDWDAVSDGGAWMAAHRYKVGSPPTGTNDGTRIQSDSDRLTFPAPSAPGTYPVYVWLEDAAGNTDHTHVSSGVMYISSPRQWVYRFYNRRTGTHFYTGTEAERDEVASKLGWLYQYEGPAYQALAGPYGGVPLHRFFNRRTGTHFYTANPAEKLDVETRLSWLYAYEGITYYVCATDQGGACVYRFYNRKNGVHFYTASETERDDVMARLGWLFAYEGPAFYMPE